MDEDRHASDDSTAVRVDRVQPLGAGKGRWARLAARLGLLHLGRGGPFGGTRMLVGDRSGYLVAVSPSHAVRASSVDILVRFPLGHTVRGFREDVVKKLPRRRRKYVYVGDGAVLMRIPYAVVPPFDGAVERALDGLVGAISEHVATLDRTCEGCRQPNDLGIYLIDDVPALYCERCIERYVRDDDELAEQVAHTSPDLGYGAAVGALAALAIGVAAGGPAGAAIVKLGPLGSYAALVLFAVAGYLVSALMSRGFQAASVVTTLLKVPALLLCTFVMTTTLTCVTRMALRPAEWNLLFLFTSFWIPIVSTPKVVAVSFGATLAGWLAETAGGAVFGGRRRRARRVRIERLESTKRES